MVGLRSGGALDQRYGSVALTVTMNVVAQPGQEFAEITPGERLVQPGQVRPGPGEELRRVDVAERVGWEIAKEPGAPVDVLQAALGIVRGRDSQGLAVLLVPCVGQLADWQFIGKQGLLQLEADDDVQVVSHLVGLDPDQAGLHVVDGGQELVERDIMKGLVKHPPGHREPVHPERPASPHRVFPEPRLRLVHAQGDRLAHRRAKMLCRQPLFIERVADLVENAKECITELTLVVAGRDPGVTGPDPGAEWVSRHVQPAPLKVETQRRGDRLPKDPLSIERIGAA